jgi:hypothetical protein
VEEDTSQVDLSLTKIVLNRSKGSILFIIFLGFSIYGMPALLLLPVVINFYSAFAGFIALNLLDKLIILALFLLYMVAGIMLLPFFVRSTSGIFNPDYLQLSPQGMEIKQFRNKVFIRWIEIQDIEVGGQWNVFYMMQWMGFNFSELYTDKPG